MPVVRSVRRPVNSAQFGVWFDMQLDPGSPGYNLAEAMEIHGPVQEGLFEQAFRRVIEDYDALRVVFGEDAQGWPEQTVLDRLDWSLEVIDVSREDDPRASAFDWMDGEACSAMDITKEPPFISVLFKVSEDGYIWYKQMHHIMMDGPGMDLVSLRLAEVYTCLVTGEPVPAVSAGGVLGLLDQDTAYRSSAQFALDRAFWTERLKDLPDPPVLSGRPSGRQADFCHRWVEVVSQRQLDLYRSSARACATTWAALVNAAAAAYLHRATGATDVSIGSPVPGRRGCRTTVGMTSGFLPLRLSMTPRTIVTQLVRSAARELRSLLKHQRYRHEDIRRDLNLTHSPRQLIGPTVNVLSFHDFRLTFGGHKVSGHNISLGSARDLTITACERGATAPAEFIFDADPAVYTQEEVERHGRRFVRFVDTFAASLTTPLSELPF